MAAISCDPNSIAKASVCFCFDKATADAAMVYLLNNISGLNLTPNQLAQNSKCFCFDNQTMDAVKTYLLCAIAQKVGA